MDALTERETWVADSGPSPAARSQEGAGLRVLGGGHAVEVAGRTEHRHHGGVKVVVVRDRLLIHHHSRRWS